MTLPAAILVGLRLLFLHTLLVVGKLSQGPLPAFEVFVSFGLAFFQLLAQCLVLLGFETFFQDAFHQLRFDHADVIQACLAGAFSFDKSFSAAFLCPLCFFSAMT